MKKFLALFLPLLIVFSLIGCRGTHYNLINADLREVRSSDNAQGRSEVVGYETKIDGKWYDSDKNGQLSAKGELQKQAFESRGEGGGGC